MSQGFQSTSSEEIVLHEQILMW